LKAVAEIHATVRARGQEHLLRWCDGLGEAQRGELLASIESIPWDVVDGLIQTHVLRAPGTGSAGSLAPATVYPHEPGAGRREMYRKAREEGAALLRAGKIAAFTVAGGQGSRLGVSGPKGAVVVTPVGGRTLFQFFAEMVLAARRKYAANIPWYIMTSPANHEETIGFFQKHGFFDLPRDDVIFFPQGTLPAFNFSGKILLDERHRVALAPDGHGGSLKAMKVSGALDDMRRRGIEIISYFQVDNPLVQPFDPLFIGLHRSTGSEMSTKVARKADDLERVGNVCLKDGKLAVVEYTEFPEITARAKNPDGTRMFDAGNLAIHLLDADFVRRVTAGPLSLPYRRAEKAVAYVDDFGTRVEPKKPNAVKLETFIFDVLPLAKNPLVLEVDRAEEFSPVKNATGVDSLETAQRDLVRRSCRWLAQAGVPIPRRADGEPDAKIVLSPLRVLDGDDLPNVRDCILPIARGESRYLTSDPEGVQECSHG